VSRVIDEHRLYLRDRHRISAYERAINEVVAPGAVVVDLASGTGILGLLACRAGARRVYAIEQEGIVGLARQIATANGYGGRITSIRGEARHVTLPERGDVVVADQIGGFGLEAGIFDLFKDARVRFLRDGGTLVPNAVELMIAPAEVGRMHRRLQFWESRPAGFDASAASEVANNTGYPLRLVPGDLLATPACAACIDLLRDHDLPLRLSASMRADRAGMLHGIAGWFVARLSPGVTMTNSPLSNKRIFRRQVFFPIAEPVEVAAGSAIDVTMSILPSDLLYSWQVEVTGRDGTARRFQHSTLRGMLLAREDLARTRPSHRPVLTAAGEARLTVLRLCDGHRELSEIERLVYEQHPSLFADVSDAAMFVAEVVTRYSRG
jgi:protein arginine N-methyltransferase 1